MAGDTPVTHETLQPILDLMREQREQDRDHVDARFEALTDRVDAGFREVTRRQDVANGRTAKNEGAIDALQRNGCGRIELHAETIAALSSGANRGGRVSVNLKHPGVLAGGGVGALSVAYALFEAVKAVGPVLEHLVKP